MAGRRTNLALLVLLAAAVGTGTLAYAIGTGAGRWVVIGHGVAGIAIVGLAPWKQVIARRGVRRRRPGWSLSLAFSVLVAAALVFGIAHAAGLRETGPLTTMQIHVGAAVASIPLAIWHVVVRKVRPRTVDLNRRNALRAGVVLAAAGAAYAATELGKAAVALPGAERRFTGSFETGSFRPDRMPVTQWFTDSVPAIEAAGWRLRIVTLSGERRLAYDELAAFDESVRATIDCTGGWYAVQDWSGVRLDRLLGPQSGSSVRAISATGYDRRYPITDLENLWLATRAGGRPLSAGHGFPARIVAPGRRGFWWVKWVVELRVDDIPWWWQPPFPPQ